MASRKPEINPTVGIAIWKSLPQKEVVPTEGGRSDGLKDWWAAPTLQLLNRDLEIAPTEGNRSHRRRSLRRIKRLVRGAHPTTAQSRFGNRSHSWESRPGEDLYGISIALLIQSLDQSLFIPLISYKEKKPDCALQLLPLLTTGH